MLQQVMEEIHNMFITERYRGTYAISDGLLSPLSGLKEGQRFWLVGSDLNDGVYTWHENGIKNDDDTDAVGLLPETFAGTICALAVPPAVIALAGEIKTWVDTYNEQLNNPFVSESVIGVYSYEKIQNSKVGGGTPNITWQDMFRKRLDRWRKVSF